jgi:putative ABC transport system permease protein
MTGKNREKTVAYVDKVRQEFKDQYPFEYKFLDQTLGEYYKSEERIGLLARSFTLLTILIAALGLLGLSSFLTQSRTREIGVRKVVGASANTIVMMFVKQFSIWVLIANVIAAPLAWYAMDKWLEEFPYKSGIHWWIFVIALAASLLIALLTVSFRVFRAAAVNPSDAMRYE